LRFNHSVRSRSRVRMSIVEQILVLSLSSLSQIDIAGDCEKICPKSLSPNRAVVQPGADERLRSDILCIETVTCKPKGKTIDFSCIGIVQV